MAIDEEEDDYAEGQEIVLHEDKQYYPDPEKIFGKDVETLVMELLSIVEQPGEAGCSPRHHQHGYMLVVAMVAVALELGQWGP